MALKRKPRFLALRQKTTSEVNPAEMNGSGTLVGSIKLKQTVILLKIFIYNSHYAKA